MVMNGDLKLPCRSKMVEIAKQDKVNDCAIMCLGLVDAHSKKNECALRAQRR